MDLPPRGVTPPTWNSTPSLAGKWTWAATLLQSSNVAYKFGVAGPFWYASGATIQVLLFAIMAVEIKRKAPTAHTVLEVVRARWGTLGHVVFLPFCLLTNIIVTSMLILGGAAVLNGLTGVRWGGGLCCHLCCMHVTLGLPSVFDSAGHTQVVHVSNTEHACVAFPASLPHTPQRARIYVGTVWNARPMSCSPPPDALFSSLMLPLPLPLPLPPPPGMNIYAAAFLLPVGVMAYTAQGGLKASYIAAWANTGCILLALVIFGMMTYASGRYDDWGGPGLGKVWGWEGLGLGGRCPVAGGG